MKKEIEIYAGYFGVWEGIGPNYFFGVTADSHEEAVEKIKRILVDDFRAIIKIDPKKIERVKLVEVPQ